MKDYRPAEKYIEVTPGESLRIVRELQELNQSQLALLTGLAQSSISAMESGDAEIDIARAKVLARALKCHPAVLVFPGWEQPRDQLA